MRTCWAPSGTRYSGKSMTPSRISFRAFIEACKNKKRTLRAGLALHYHAQELLHDLSNRQGCACGANGRSGGFAMQLTSTLALNLFCFASLRCLVTKGLGSHLCSKPVCVETPWHVGQFTARGMRPRKCFLMGKATETEQVLKVFPSPRFSRIDAGKETLSAKNDPSITCHPPKECETEPRCRLLSCCGSQSLGGRVSSQVLICICSFEDWAFPQSLH